MTIGACGQTWWTATEEAACFGGTSSPLTLATCLELARFLELARYGIHSKVEALALLVIGAKTVRGKGHCLPCGQ